MLDKYVVFIYNIMQSFRIVRSVVLTEVLNTEMKILSRATSKAVVFS
jgi:hypothetical protein